MKAQYVEFNVAMALGVALIGIGVGLVSVPWALVTVGALMIALTLFIAVRRGL